MHPLRLMPLRHRVMMLCAFTSVLLGSCGPRQMKEVPVREASAPAAIDLQAVLGQMPTNSDERCMGISLVMEALLDGRPDGTASSDELPQLARRIYASTIHGEQLRFSPQIASRVALEKLCTQVADLYKQDYRRALETEAAREKLLAAETNFLRTGHELQGVLAADPDQTVAFVGSGKRHFADGTVKETHHAFLISKKENGQLIVFDPNDPGEAIPALVQETAEGLVVEWTCRYRDTQQITTQGYRIVPLSQYLRDGLGSDARLDLRPKDSPL